MSYADATKKGSSSSYGNSSGDKNLGKYFNDKLLICHKDNFTCEDVAEAMDKKGYFDQIIGLQTLGFGRTIGIEIAEVSVINELLVHGLVIKGNHRTFWLHKRREGIKVYVHQLPLGITQLEVRRAFGKYGKISNVMATQKVYRNRSIANGDWCVYFVGLNEAIPSYVAVRGWYAYTTYRGQVKTCRLCHSSDHLAKDCPKNRNRNQAEDAPNQEPQKERQPEDITEDMASDIVLEKVTVEDCQTPTSVEPEGQQITQEPETRSQAWADSPEENPFEVGSEKPQEDSSSEPATPTSVQGLIFGTDTEISEDESPVSQSIWGDNMEVKKPTVYCPQCREDSHSEEECTASIIDKANKKALSTEDRKKRNKGKVTFKQFTNHLDLVVMRGNNTDEVQYIRELSEGDQVFALYLLFTYGDYAGAQHRDFPVSENQDVMELWRRLSRTMDKTAAEERLLGIYDQL